MRERLLADGHAEATPDGGDVAVVNTCCVTHEARREVAPGRRRAPRARTRRVYVTGCAREPRGDAFAGLPENVVVVARPSEETAAVVAGDVGAIGCVQADARLDRVRAFVKIQDGCSFSCNFCVIPLVRGAHAQPPRRRGARRDPPPRRRRATARSCSPGINLGCFRDREAGYDLPRLVREAGAIAGLDAPAAVARSRSTTSTDELVAALRETPTVSRAPPRAAPVGRRRRAARDGAPLHASRRTCARLEPLGDFNLTTDVIVGFPAEDEAAFARTLDDRRARAAHEGARLPVLAAARARRRPRDDTVPPR